MAGVVVGAEDVARAFSRAGSSFHREKTQRLKFFAQPVARDAAVLAVARIDRIGIPWSQMRVGATPNLVYVAPQKRGTRIVSRKRPKLARLLLTRAMEPALERNRPQIERQFDELAARMERDFRRG